jgi:hypothetical protein
MPVLRRGRVVRFPQERLLAGLERCACLSRVSQTAAALLFLLEPLAREL